MITTLTKGLKGLLAVGLGAFMLALAPHAFADTNDNDDVMRWRRTTSTLSGVPPTWSMHDAGRVYLLIPGFGLLSRRYC